MGDVTQIVMGQSPDSLNYTDNSNDTILIQGNADLNNGIVVPRIWSTQITKKSYPKDIIFTVRAPVGEIARNPYFATIGRGVAAFKGNDFLYQSLIQKKENNYWNNISAGSTFDSINSEQLKNVIIDFPNNSKEQERIGNLFNEIDNLITLHQRKQNSFNLYKTFTKFNFITINKNAWEQRKLEDIGDNFSTGTLGYADLSEDGKYKCVLYGDLYTKFDERIFNVKSRTNTEATKVEINDILFPTSTTVDNISLIAPSCVNQANIRVGGDLFGIRPYKNIDGNFISYCINNFTPIKYSFAKQAQGLTIVHLQYNAVKNEMLMVPCIDEQKRMSQLFIEIDNLITLHHRKFIKFFYSWEQRKLGEIINETIDNRGKNPPYYCESGIPVIDNFMIKNNGYPDLKTATRYLDDYLFSNFIRKHNEKDDVLITLVGNGIGNIALFSKEKSAIVQNTIGMRFEHPQKFKYYSLLSKNNEIVKLDRGMAQPSIRQDELKNLDINLPTEKEQSKIESLMTNLDNLITLHQHKELKRRNDKNEHLRW